MKISDLKDLTVSIIKWGPKFANGQYVMRKTLLKRGYVMVRVNGYSLVLVHY